MRIKDTTSHLHRTLSWPCLSAYLLLALTIVIGLYVGVNWQFQSAVHSALKLQLSQPLEMRDATWFFALAFLGIFASTAILHHVFASILLKRLETPMEHDSSQDITEQALSQLPDNSRASLRHTDRSQAEEGSQRELRQEDHQPSLEDTQALGMVPDQSRDTPDNFALANQELHTPMSEIIGMTRKLLETSLDDEQQQYMTRLREETYILTGMLDELLGFSELKTQHWQLETIPFDLRQTLLSCCDLLAEQARAKQLTFYCCVMSGVPQQFLGDDGRIGQILYNLLANAIKSTDAGTVAICVSGHLEGETRVRLSFEIYDSAREMDTELISQLNAPTVQTKALFSQDCDETESELAISKQLIQLMQGHINIQSLPGEGTIWQFSMCLGYLPDQEDVSKSLSLHRMPVLYVDCSELNNRLLYDQFESWEMAPTTMTDASSVISVLNTAMQQANAFPLVVIRHDPTNLDGYALCQEIRNSGVSSEIKLVLLKSEEERNNPLEFDSYPYDLSLAFPIYTTTLYDNLQKLMSHTIKTVSTHEEVSEQPSDPAPSNVALHILLVEDNRVNQQVALSMLKKWGHQIDVAWNGLEALEAVQRQDYDLILMDIQMPEMDGVTATQHIRQLDGKRGVVPIVAVTANAMQGDRERFLAAGIDDSDF